MQITLCARSKILNLLDEGKVFRIQRTECGEAGSHVDLIPNAELAAFDCIISHVPLVVADLFTATHMASQYIDFDYQSGEFLISI